uniref:Uncharacterized protein n=1 Tax=Siphoviridae sp. ctLqe90 TaxID=2825456 RepID=A0A8S5Q2M0_9CAUD|nr:MAG TPA: hypothetical protein [Siphoviridae sp. ctLqe90]
MRNRRRSPHYEPLVLAFKEMRRSLSNIFSWQSTYATEQEFGR